MEAEENKKELKPKSARGRKKEAFIKDTNLIRTCKRALQLYFANKKDYDDLKDVPKDMIINEFLRHRKELHDIYVEHKIMKKILIENNLWEELLNDDEFLEFLREDYEG